MADKRGLGGLGSSKPKSRLPTFSEFINPFSLPPGETDRGMKGPTLREVIVPPTTPGRPPGVAPEGWGNYLLDFLNPFSAPPGADYIRESGLSRPDTPRQPSLQDRLPPGWTTEGPWRQSSQPPSSMAERMLEEEGLPTAIPGGPPTASYEREQLASRAYPQPIGYQPPSGFEAPPPDYKNLRPRASRILPPELPPGWQPPLTLRQRIERQLEAQQRRRSPGAELSNPVLRRKKPKDRESEA